MRASEARQGCMAPMVSKSTPSSSPAALRSRSQRIVARSEAGCAMRATTEPSAASRSAALTPSDSSRAGRPSSPSAHSAACSTPAERGRASARLSTATASTPPAASSAGAAPRASSCAAMRCASVSTASGTSPNRSPWPSRTASTRWHGSGQSSRSTSKWRPRLSSVRWRTRAPSRSERTRRWVWQTAPPSVARVLVRRTNMGGRWRRRRSAARNSGHFMALHLPPANWNSMKSITCGNGIAENRPIWPKDGVKLVKLG